MNRTEALAYRRKIEHAASQQSDEDALQSIELFPKWNDNFDAVKDERRSDLNANGKLTLYKCLQPHHTQAGWEPHNTPALWTPVSLDEWPEIPESIPAEKPWMTGQKGTWKGEHYICKMDNCVWNPDQYPQAWERV